MGERVETAVEKRAEKAGRPQCTCVDIVNTDLRKRGLNTFVVQELFSGAVVVATDKVETRSRTRARVCIASFCPFCGTRYAPCRGDAPVGAKAKEAVAPEAAAHA